MTRRDKYAKNACKQTNNSGSCCCCFGCCCSCFFFFYIWWHCPCVIPSLCEGWFSTLLFGLLCWVSGRVSRLQHLHIPSPHPPATGSAPSPRPSPLLPFSILFALLALLVATRRNPGLLYFGQTTTTTKVETAAEAAGTDSRQNCAVNARAHPLQRHIHTCRHTHT